MTAEELARQKQEVFKQNAGDEWEPLSSYFEISYKNNVIGKQF